MIHRGMQFSDYSVAYEKLFSSDSAEFSDDPYAVAIRNLHLSVIPVNLPCRTKELASLQQYILVGLRERYDLVVYKLFFCSRIVVLSDREV